ncbi:MAG: flagellar hook-associated protein FlgK [Pseudomonadota bacterium]|nr:flagellar hook-associated protein FlgK [Pseudomonadota bacterium]
MANSILSIGASAIAAAQAGLVTTGHNISNVNTPGYSRQEAIQVDRNYLFTGGGYLGQGVDIATVRRSYSEFLAARALSSQTQSSAMSVRQDQLSQLDNMFGDVTSGLSPALDTFFAGINAVAANPADTSSRQTALSAAQGLVGRLRQLDGQLTDLRNAANTRVAGTVTSINNIGAQIASLNARILNAASAGAGNTPPNDLLDQRDQLVMDLNKSIGATAVPQSDGTYNVFLSNGQALVTGVQTLTVSATADPQDPRNLVIGLVNAGQTTIFHSGDFAGGELQGVLAFRDGDLAAAENSIGRIAVALGSAFNVQHRLGQDLNGVPGGDFFSVPAPNVQPALSNSGNASVTAAIADGTQITTSDYRLAYDGTNYVVTRLSDSAAQTFATLPQTVDGVTFTLSSGAAAAGDTFLVQPTRYGARDIGVALTSPAQIAAAAPIRTSVSVTNLGSGTISQGSVDAGYPLAPLTSAVVITYSKSAGTLTGFPPLVPVTVQTGNTTTTYAPGTPVPYTAGATISFGPRFTISGTLADGDSFTVAPNSGARGDNRNAQLLASLARSNVVGGTQSVHAAYGELVGSIGSAAQQAQVENDAQTHLLHQAQSAQQAASGVNLDEEAANLQRYQQAYLAAGKLMSVAATLFDSILNIGRN